MTKHHRTQQRGILRAMQAGKAIVQEVEKLDAALKKNRPAEECRQLVRQIRHEMSELLASS